MKAPLRAVAGPTNGWSNNKYYVNGTVSTGETKIGQDRYLFDNDGNPLKGFMYYDGKLLYCTSAGKIQSKRQIKDVCMKRKTWDTISFVIPFPRSSFLLPDIQIFGYSL